jgi:hypothetical protein
MYDLSAGSPSSLEWLILGHLYYYRGQLRFPVSATGYADTALIPANMGPSTPLAPPRRGAGDSPHSINLDIGKHSIIRRHRHDLLGSQVVGAISQGCGSFGVT